MSSLRQRKTNPESRTGAAMTTPSSSSSSSAPKGRSAQMRGATMSRPRLLFLFLPILLAWCILFSRRSLASKTLPSIYAVCSPKGTSQILTMRGGEQKRERCLVVQEGKVKGLGSLEYVRERWGDKETVGQGRGIRIIFLRKGQMLMPGLIDAHAHILQNGEAASAVDLVGSSSVQDVIERIASFIENNVEIKQDRSKFILGLGWDQTKWPGGNFPTALDLDSDPRLKGRPIYLKRIDVHALWVSNSILEKMGALPDQVPGGLIVRLADGSASGVFLDNAMNFVTAVIPPWTDDDRLRFLTTTARQMLDLGLTSVHDASLSLSDISFLQRIDKAGRLPIRIYGMVSCEPLNSYCGDRIERYDGDRFVVRAVKLFTDGALGSWGAAMKEPYSDNLNERGILISPKGEIAPLVKKWIDKGFQVNSHAIGDRAAQVVLDAYEKSVTNHTSLRDLRLRLEHAQILTQDDIARTGRLGVISSVQPTHATSDMGYAESRIGPERIKGAYAWKSLQEAGSPLALGSDFPVEKVDPLLGIYAATTRKWLNGDSPHGSDGWYPSEKLSMLETIQGFTTGAAFAAFQEGRVGSLDMGKEADFIVLDKDFFKVEDFEIPEIKVKATVVGGRMFAGRLQ